MFVLHPLNIWIAKKPNSERVLPKKLNLSLVALLYHGLRITLNLVPNVLILYPIACFCIFGLCDELVLLEFLFCAVLYDVFVSSLYLATESKAMINYFLMKNRTKFTESVLLIPELNDVAVETKDKSDGLLPSDTQPGVQDILQN